MKVLILLLGIFSLAKGAQEAIGNGENEEQSLPIESSFAARESRSREERENIEDEEHSLPIRNPLDAGESSNRKERLFGSFSTTTYTVVSAVTSTVFFSCLSGTDATVCQGRNTKRLRRGSRTKAIELEDGDDPSLPNLEASALSEPTREETSEVGESKTNNEKFGFTIWTTARTTTSVTVFYTNTSTTIRLSYYCVAGGIQFPNNNCAG